MKTMMLAAAAVLSLGVGSAFAGDGEGVAPNTLFTSIPGVVARAQVQQVPSAVAQAQNGTAAFVTQSSHGTWLFAPNANEGGNN